MIPADEPVATPAPRALLVAIGPHSDGAVLIHAAHAHAVLTGRRWYAVYVETPATQRLDRAQRARVLDALQAAERMGAETRVLAGPYPSAELLGFAAQHAVDLIVVGRSSTPAWRRWLVGSATDALVNTAYGVDILFVADAAATRDRVARLAPAYSLLVEDHAPRLPVRGLVMGMLIAAIGTGLSALLAGTLAEVNLVMIYLVGVLLAAVRYGRAAGYAASLLSVLAFDVFFVPPQGSFAVHDAEYLLTFAVMLLVAFIISGLASGQRLQARVAAQREQRVSELYAMTRELAETGDAARIAAIGAAHVSAVFGAPATVRVASDAAPGLAVPIPGGHGSLVLDEDSERLRAPEQRRHLEVFAAQIGAALDRIAADDAAVTARLAAERERLRSTLLAAISHDLRTPLTSMLGGASVLARGETDPARRATAESIATEAARLDGLVTKVLDLARLQTGGLAVRLDWISLEEVVGAALAGLGAAASARDIRVAVPADLGLIEADAFLLERLLTNLVENALKHAPAPARIEISARRMADSVELEVADDGPGLPPGRESALFEAFERGTRDESTPGVGLGLAICRLVADAHGGRIAARLGRARGAAFVLTLPQARRAPDIETEP